MGNQANILGIPSSIEFQGVTYNLSKEIKFEVECQYSLYLESNAREAIQRHMGKMKLPEYREHISQWQKDCAAEVYDFGSPVFHESLKVKRNQKHLAFLVLKYFNPDARITPSLVDRMAEDEKTWALIESYFIGIFYPNVSRPESEVQTTDSETPG